MVGHGRVRVRPTSTNSSNLSVSDLLLKANEHTEISRNYTQWLVSNIIEEDDKDYIQYNLNLN